jgi:hypothetical protein
MDADGPMVCRDGGPIANLSQVEVESKARDSPILYESNRRNFSRKGAEAQRFKSNNHKDTKGTKRKNLFVLDLLCVLRVFVVQFYSLFSRLCAFACDSIEY